MTQAQIERFIQHYERVTRQNLTSLATTADVRLELGQDHQVVSAQYKS
jgi:D-glycerate 3-kinase